jgi:hypothetical protein
VIFHFPKLAILSAILSTTRNYKMPGQAAIPILFKTLNLESLHIIVYATMHSPKTIWIENAFFQLLRQCEMNRWLENKWKVLFQRAAAQLLDFFATYAATRHHHG